MTSPYKGQDCSKWPEITKRIVMSHPLTQDLVDAVLDSWNTIFESNIGSLQIGKNLFPAPQVMGNFLHELIALYLSQKHAGKYKKGDPHTEKDVHCIDDNALSFEIKTSSNPSKIFGNRSYAQPSSGNEAKSKDGFMLAVNFEKFTNSDRPDIILIRFGYLEHSDWIAQKSSTGQQARLSAETYQTKFITLYTKKTGKIQFQE